ncbi:unnamed protein product [Blepharisma stoltei]|uniref:Vacuolar protein sorting-associated protein n=1 Tax=Blepharisma stoltei TaxID=1481888 RepID=A0AAU9JUT4_9CILI|nr:unnamed protein product [Blepharisma stoltei]
MNSAIAKVLNKVLGDFVEGLSSDQLNISMFSGEVSLKNLRLKKEALQKLGLPFNLTSGFVGRLFMKIPWKSLGSSPLQVEVENVFALVNPKPPTEWSESKERESAIISKALALESFEALNSSLELNSAEPGYIEKLISKIIDNLIVNVKNIYLRYDDSVSSIEHFSVGVILREMKAETCNSKWVPEYVPESNVCFKLTTVKGFALFFDYGKDMIKIEEDSGKNLAVALEELANLELLTNAEHKYLLSPIDIRIELILYKDSKKYDTPQGLLTIHQSDVVFSVFPGQLTHVLKLVEFIDLFKSFQKGVERSAQERKFTKNEAKNYRETYKKWRSLTINKPKEAEKLKKVLDEQEQGVDIEELTKERNRALKETEIIRREEEKRKEIEEIKNKPIEGGLSKFKGWFGGGKSEEEKKKEQEEKNMKIKKAEEELKLILQEKEQVSDYVEMSGAMPVSLNGPLDWVQWRVLFDVKSSKLIIFDENTEMLSGELRDFSVDFGLRPNTLYVFLKFGTLVVNDNVTKSQIFPDIFKGSHLDIQFDQYPVNTLKASGGESLICLHPQSLFSITNVYLGALTKNVDVNKYLSEASEKTGQIIEKGDKYLKDMIKTGTQQSIILDVTLKSPIIIIPTDSNSLEKPFLVIDNGTFTASTSIETLDGLDFDRYNFLIKKVKVCSVLPCESVEKWHKGDIENILDPFDIEMVLFNCKIAQTMVPSIRVKSIIDKIILKLTDSQLLIFIEILNLFSNQEKVEIERKNEEIKEDEELIEGKGFKDNLKEIGEILSIAANIRLNEIQLNIIEKNLPLTKIAINDIDLNVKSDKYGNIDLDFILEKLAIEDLRPDIEFPNVVSNPLEYQREWDTDENTSYENMTQVKIFIHLKPRNDQLDVGVRLNDIRFVACASYAESLLKFASHQLNQIQQAKSVQVKAKPVSTATTTYHSRFSVLFSNFELWVPLDPSNPKSKIASFSLSLSTIYTASAEIKYTYDVLWRVISSENIWAEEDASVDIRQLNAMLGYSKNNLMRTDKITRDLITPSRISASYKSITNEASTKMEANLSIESLCVVYGFRDILFFQEVAKPWLAIDFSQFSEKKKSHSQVENKDTIHFSFDCDSLQLTMLEDTTKNPYSLLHMQFSNMMATGEQKESQKFEFSTIMNINYYNSYNSTWEPLLEDWNFSLLMKQLNPKAPIELALVSLETLNINLSYSMAETVSLIIKRFSQNLSDWGNEKFYEQGEEMDGLNKKTYKIYNKLGKDLEVWIDSPNAAHWKLKNEKSVKFGQDQINSLFMVNLAHSKTTSMLQTAQTPSAIALTLESFYSVHGIIIENAGMQLVMISNGDTQYPILINVKSYENKQEIHIQSGIVIMNNTDFPITLILNTDEMTIKENSSSSLPFSWLDSASKIAIKTSTGTLEITSTAMLRIDENLYVLIENFSYIFDGVRTLRVMEINPPILFENLLPCPMTVYYDENSSSDLILSGTHAAIYKFNPEQKFKFEIHIDENTKVSTGWINSFEKARISLLEKPKSSLHLEKSVKDFRSCSNLDLLDLEKTSQDAQESLKNILITISAEHIIINKTGHDLQVESLLVEKNQIGFFSSKKNKIKIKFPEEDQWSGGFNKNTIGISGLVKVPKTLQERNIKTLMFGVNIANAPLPLVKTKVITLCPRYIIANYLGYPVYIKQYDKRKNQQFTKFRLEDNEKIQYQPDDLSIQVGVQVSADGNRWSGPFNIDDLEDFQIRFPGEEQVIVEDNTLFKLEDNTWHIPRQTNGNMHYARIVVSSEDEATIFINFVVPKNPEYKISNHTEEIITIKQSGFDDFSMTIKPGSVVPWAFDDNLVNNKKIIVESENAKNKYSLEKIQKQKNFGNHKVEVVVEGVTRQLNISEPDLPKGTSIVQALYEMFAVKSSFKVLLEMKGIGLSIIDEKPTEKIYISMMGLFAKLKKTDILFGKRLDTALKADIKLGNFQIDNMDNMNSMFPVIYSPVAINKEESGEIVPFIQFKLQREIRTCINQQSNTIDKISWLELLIQSMQAKINEDTLWTLLKLQGNILDKLNASLENLSTENKGKYMKDLYPQLAATQPVLPFDPTLMNKKTYFLFIRLCAIKLNLTFRKKMTQIRLDPKKGFGAAGLLETLSGAFANISDSPLFFRELMMTQCFQTLDNLTWIIMKNYIRQGIIQVYKILGSSDMIGNPIGLVDKLGTGVFEFFNEPAKGLLKGPKSFAQGVGKGFKSLVGNVIAGGFGSVSKITGSLYKVVKQVGGNDEDVHKINESDNIGKNMYEGFKGGVMDVADGIKGVFTKPWKGAKEGGAKGFFKGLGSGVAGLVVSPVAAVLKFGSTITGGVSSAAILLARGKVQTLGRVRFPRQFGARRILEAYNSELAEAQELLKNLQGHKGEQMIYYIHIVEEEDLILILTTKYILFLVDAELIKQLKVEEIDKLEVHRFDKQFYMCVATPKDEFVLKSWSYGPIAKMYTAVISLPNSLKNRKSIAKVKVPAHYKRECC